MLLIKATVTLFPDIITTRITTIITVSCNSGWAVASATNCARFLTALAVASASRASSRPTTSLTNLVRQRRALRFKSQEGRPWPSSTRKLVRLQLVPMGLIIPLNNSSSRLSSSKEVRVIIHNRTRLCLTTLKGLMLSLPLARSLAASHSHHSNSSE